jgi:hypothetical protein
VARVTVRINDLDDGRFPAVCAKTGVPCTTTVRSEWKVIPGWTWFLFFFGFVPFLFVRFCASERVDGRIPVTPAAFERQRNASRVALASLVVGLVAVVWGIADGRYAIAGFGLVCVIGAAVAALLS